MSSPEIKGKYGWEQTKEIWRESIWLWAVPGLFLGIIVGVLWGLSSTADLDNWFITGFWPEVLSTAITVLLLYRLDKWRDDKREQSRLRNDLLWQVKSRSTDMAISAIDRMRYEGWIEGETSLLKGIDFKHLSPKWREAELHNSDLSGAKLGGADLYKSRLSNSNLENVGLSEANLSHAHLFHSNMRNIWLVNANLENAQIDGVDMQWADLYGTNLKDANFNNTKLQFANMRRSDMRNAYLFLTHLSNVSLAGADLRGAYLLGADIEDVEWTGIQDGPAILPNGEKYSDKVDVTRFTNPDHPDLWIPPQMKTLLGDTGITGNLEIARKVLASRKNQKEEIWLPERIKQYLKESDLYTDLDL